MDGLTLLTARTIRGYDGAPMSFSNDRITVCICTYKRPAFLARLLEKLLAQRTDSTFSVSVVVVDNDSRESGREAIWKVQENATYALDYMVEPERSISLARNRSVANATGNIIAFIDDDEFPEDDWLLRSYRVLRDSGATGVLGPVRPDFGPSAPRWLIKSGICERREFSTGTVLTDARYTRTGNALVWKSLFADAKDRFDPVFGRAGGGDALFFKRMMAKGHVFVWCNEAVVYETVTPDRYKKSYYVRRAFTRGMMEARDTPPLSLSTLRSMVAIPGYSLILPFTMLFGQHVFMKFLIKDCDHLSKMLAHLGIRPVKERPY